MSPIVKTLQSYIKDSQPTLISLAKTNLFLSWILHLLILSFLIWRRCLGPQTFWNTILRLTKRVLTLNCFSFWGYCYKQTNGVAIGSKMGPNYANLFVGFIEHQFFSQYNDPKPELYGRFINDCTGATSCIIEELTQVLTAVNFFHLALKYTWEISDDSMSTVCVLECTTNLQTYTVTCCIRLRRHPSRVRLSPFHIRLHRFAPQQLSLQRYSSQQMWHLSHSHLLK